MEPHVVAPLVAQKGGFDLRGQLECGNVAALGRFGEERAWSPAHGRLAADQGFELYRSRRAGAAPDDSRGA